MSLTLTTTMTYLCNTQTINIGISTPVRSGIVVAIRQYLRRIKNTVFCSWRRYSIRRRSILKRLGPRAEYRVFFVPKCLLSK